MLRWDRGVRAAASLSRARRRRWRRRAVIRDHLLRLSRPPDPASIRHPFFWISATKTCPRGAM